MAPRKPAYLIKEDIEAIRRLEEEREKQQSSPTSDAQPKKTKRIEVIFRSSI